MVECLQMKFIHRQYFLLTIEIFYSLDRSQVRYNVVLRNGSFDLTKRKSLGPCRERRLSFNYD